MKVSFAASANSVRDESGCRSTMIVSFSATDTTGGQNPVTSVVLKVNGAVWNDSGSISTDYHKAVEERQVGCGETFNYEVTATNQGGQTATATGSLTTPSP